MKYLNMLMLSITISATSLGLLNAACHDPILSFAATIYIGAENCNNLNENFGNLFVTDLNTMTPKQSLQAFVLAKKVSGKDPISLARSIGSKNCLEYADVLENLKENLLDLIIYEEFETLKISEVKAKSTASEQ